MKKEIRYPSSDWLENYVNAHNCSLSDAEIAWWDAEIDKGNPTPFDLNEEQEKEVKKMRKNAKSENAVNAYGKAVKRERKPDEDKRAIIEEIHKAIIEWIDQNAVIVNPERQIDFGDYTITLTKHRKKKE